jgi:hypothetical protein
VAKGGGGTADARAEAGFVGKSEKIEKIEVRI